VKYYELLERWNRTINLTSLRNRDAAMDRLLIEPIAASTFLPNRPRLMDIGSGGGSPAIPLAIATGAGAGARNSVGTAVGGGMILSTILSVIFIPVLYVVIRSIAPGRVRGHDTDVAVPEAGDAHA